MNTILAENCEKLIENREALKKAFAWDDDRMKTIAASMYLQSGKNVDADRIDACRKQIKERAGVFSEIRGLVFNLLACMTDIRGGQEYCFDQLMSSYKTLRGEFHASSYLALGAEILAENYPEDEYACITAKAKEIYKLMKADHPFLTGEDDYLMCILLAQSQKESTVLTGEIEKSYQYLKEGGLHTSGNALQSISCVLALYEGEVSEKCNQFLHFYEELKAKGYKYDKHYGLPMLAVLSQSELSIEDTLTDIRDVHDFLKKQKGFGMLMGEASRMVFAAMLVTQTYSAHKTDETKAGTYVAGGVISAIIAQEIAMLACISASVAASAAASN